MSSARILVVEDDADSRELMVAMLSREGYEVEQAATAEQAAGLLDGRHYDLLLADWDLPGRSGASLAAHHSRRSPATAVLIVTAHPAPSGVDGMPVLHKPLDLAVLLDQVRQLLEAPAGSSPAEEDDDEAVIELTLYVTGGAATSARAQRNLQDVLATLQGAQISLTVCDLAKEPLRGEADRVRFSPTLVKHRPAPRAWLQGDLSNTAVLRDLLLLSGAVEAPAP